MAETIPAVAVPDFSRLVEAVPPRPPTGEEIKAQVAQERAEQLQQAQSLHASPTKRSDAIGQLAAALALAQGQMSAAARDSKNPFFKSKYASLAAVLDACRGPLSENALAYFQPVKVHGKVVLITTLLVHASGEWIEESLTLIAAQDTPQGVGSTITYGRRYGLSAMVGVAAADDDGSAASQEAPPGTKWDRGTGPLQQAEAGARSDELADEVPTTTPVMGPASGGTTTPIVAPTTPLSSLPVARTIARPKSPNGVTPVPSGPPPPPPGMKPPERAPGS